MTVSYHEWVQNNQELYWDESDVNQRLERKLARAFDVSWAFFQFHDDATSTREAAFALAVARVVEAANLRGYL